MAMIAEYDDETKPLTPRQTFRAIVAEVAAQAKTILPEAVNGRLESAVKLVLAGDVLFLQDGTAQVASSSDPAKVYTLAGNACDCQDFAYGQAPSGWCQHKIAANLQRSVERVLARRAPAVVLDEAHAPAVAPDDDWPPDEPLAPEPAAVAP